MRNFEQLTDLEKVEDFIAQHKLSFLYISRTGCSVCHSLLPQVAELMENFTEIHLAHLNAEEVTAVAERFSIFTVPVLLLFVEGKEYLREARVVHLDLFEEKLKRIVENYKQ